MLKDPLECFPLCILTWVKSFSKAIFWYVLKLSVTKIEPLSNLWFKTFSKLNTSDLQCGQLGLSFRFVWLCFKISSFIELNDFNSLLFSFESFKYDRKSNLSLSVKDKIHLFDYWNSICHIYILLSIDMYILYTYFDFKSMYKSILFTTEPIYFL